MRHVFRILASCLVLSTTLVLFSAIRFSPALPDTPAQWLAIFLLAVPVQLAGDLIGHGLWNNRAARFVEAATAEKSLSLVRICYAVASVLLFGSLMPAAGHGWNVLRSYLVQAA